MSRRIVVLLSGSGRSLENLYEQIHAGSLRAEISLVVASNPAAGGIERARRRGTPVAVVPPQSAADTAAYSAEVFHAVDSVSPALVVLAGFMRIVDIPDRYQWRVINIHPALLPAFGGRGMYGHHVHNAVLASGARLSGCTVHYVTNEVDAGPIIEQRVIGVRDEDDADALAARVFEQEKIALPRSIQLHLDGKLQIRGRRVVRLAAAAGC